MLHTPLMVVVHVMIRTFGHLDRCVGDKFLEIYETLRVMADITSGQVGAVNALNGYT